MALKNFSPVKITHVLVMMLLAPRALVWGASDEVNWGHALEATWGNGLEADNATQLQVLIEESSEEQEKIGLTDERIEARVNQSLRKAGITPVPLGPEGPGTNYLYVNVTGGGNTYSISIDFKRRVFYRSRGSGLPRWEALGRAAAQDTPPLTRITSSTASQITSRCSATNF